MEHKLKMVSATKKEFADMYGYSEETIDEWYGTDCVKLYWILTEDDDSALIGVEHESGTFSVYGAGFDTEGLTQEQMISLLMREFGQ